MIELNFSTSVLLVTIAMDASNSIFSEWSVQGIVFSLLAVLLTIAACICGDYRNNAVGAARAEGIATGTEAGKREVISALTQLGPYNIQQLLEENGIDFENRIGETHSHRSVRESVNEAVREELRRELRAKYKNRIEEEVLEDLREEAREKILRSQSQLARIKREAEEDVREDLMVELRPSIRISVTEQLTQEARRQCAVDGTEAQIKSLVRLEPQGNALKSLRDELATSVRADLARETRAEFEKPVASIEPRHTSVALARTRRR